MSAEAKLKHQPLEREDQIRLVKVLSELTQEGSVQCGLHVASLWTAKFTALSYTWQRPRVRVIAHKQQNLCGLSESWPLLAHGCEAAAKIRDCARA